MALHRLHRSSLNRHSIVVYRSLSVCALSRLQLSVAVHSSSIFMANDGSISNDLELQIHKLEVEAIYAVLRALVSRFGVQVGNIPRKKEDMVTNLRDELHLSFIEYGEAIVKLNGDDLLQQIWEWRRMAVAAELGTLDNEFFTEYGEGSQYHVQEVIGKGSYGVVGAAIDTHTGERVAIKKINDVFEHVSDATRILRENKLLRLLCHPDIVQIKHIMLPPSQREFKDIYVVFELMESDLHQPKNILANSDCKLKVCDFGLARVAFNDAPSAIFWTDYVATRWYRAPELCGSFFSKYTPAIDIWIIGCIFAELLTGRPLFPGKNVVHQLDLMTDLLGTPSAESIARVVVVIVKKCSSQLANVEREPLIQLISKLEFEFERRKLAKDDVRELIYREILEYHPQMLQEYLRGGNQTNLMYPSGVDRFKRQFAHLEEHCGNKGDTNVAIRQNASLPRERVGANRDRAADDNNRYEGHSTLESPTRSQSGERSDQPPVTDVNRSKIGARSLLKSESISASKCVVVKQRKDKEEETSETTDHTVGGLFSKFSHLHS
ncbi:hypothetical protein ZIOFF_002271 [Zingiber officinale]|uniref:Protein kinase domain-containing protein n=1 Tax=Zingiber officinale TaxID=94328 RepID=A0A8J5ILL2_ZINOF|nr:hypothetical protein ZIOFF_002271 [Zingiber officinale]